ncbi:MAG: hypothetical protein ABI867_21310 [Kofleriaceae bacterium]
METSSRWISSYLAVLAIATTAIVVIFVAVDVGVERTERASARAEDLVLAEQLVLATQQYLDSGRRYLVTGDNLDRTRTKELEVALGATRTKLVANVRRDGLDARAGELERTLDAVAATLTQAIVERPARGSDAAAISDAELVARLARLEAELATRSQRLRTSLGHIVDQRHDSFATSIERSRAFARRLRWLSLAIGVIVLAAGAVLALRGRRLRRPRVVAQAEELPPPGPPPTEPRVLRP